MTATGEPPRPAGDSSPGRWRPDTYLRFAGERARPFNDLLARVGAESPATVVDLGCGEGALTASLARRWPGARVTGIDSSPDMLAAAAAWAVPGRVAFAPGDVRDVLRPVLARLDDAAAGRFTDPYAAALRAAYPPRPDGTTLLPFRRVFAVGSRST
ncbi:methyltransferase domain-containing protein [Blastococcus sp. SYSU DS0539]